MNIKELNDKLSIVDYLITEGHNTVGIPKRDAWYISPIRAPEKTASFKVDTVQNVWYDHSLGRGGNLFDLAKELHPSKTNIEVLHMLRRVIGLSSNVTAEKQAVASIKTDAPPQMDKEIDIRGATKITAPALQEYLKERRIAEQVAQQYLKQVYYNLKGKSYYALGFENDMGGYALRNKHVKLASSPSHSTFIDRGKETLIVFEGFFSFLSYETLRQYQRLPEANILVLNSLSFFPKNQRLMESHSKVLQCLDNDIRGDAATALGKSWDKGKFWDIRRFYAGEKDLNQWLVKNLDRVMIEYTQLAIAQQMRIREQSHGKEQSRLKVHGRTM